MNLLRGYEMSDSLREQDAFETFMSLLHRRIAAAVSASFRGTAEPAQQRLVQTKTPLGPVGPRPRASRLRHA